MPMTKKQLQELAKGIVSAQGNLFIKELLRSKGVRIGATKAEFLEHMFEAIDDGFLSEADFEAWLDRVEGWGNQYVYLYNWEPPPEEDWRDPKVVQARVKKAGYQDSWDASSSLAFPEDLNLTGIYFRNQRLRAVWHRGFNSMVHDKSKDYEEILDGDRYEFRAFRERSERSVMRFDLRCAEGIAGAFLQVAASSEDHKPALDQMMAVAGQLLGASTLSRVDVGEIMRKLEKRQLEGGHDFTTQQAMWSGPGAYVLFGADDPKGNYQDVDVIRQVRLALPASVVGSRARMRFQAPEEEGPAREVGVNLYGTDDRVWLRSQMTEGQVWSLLDFIRGL
jgi:hypothetical protein